MKNQHAIDAILAKKDAICQGFQNQDYLRFKAKDLQIDDGMFINGMPIEKHSQKPILNAFRIQKNFLDYKDDITPKEWAEMKNLLKKANDKTFVGRRVQKHDEEYLMDVQLVADIGDPREKLMTETVQLEKFFDMITDELMFTSDNFSTKGVFYDRIAQKVSIELINDDTDIDIFGNDVDVWKTGTLMAFNGNMFDANPFLLRQVCTNGAVSREMGMNTSISKKKFSESYIQKIISDALSGGRREFNMKEKIVGACRHLKDNNVSLSEFYQFKNFFDERDDAHVISRFFNDDKFFRYYGDISKKSKKWLTTADTGINAYNFFNQLTYIASHRDKVKLDEEKGRKLQIASTTLLFKGTLDLEDIAPKLELA